MKTAGRDIPEGFFPQDFHEEEEEDINSFFSDDASLASPPSSDSDESVYDASEVLADSPESPPPHESGRHPGSSMSNHAVFGDL